MSLRQLGERSCCSSVLRVLLFVVLCCTAHQKVLATASSLGDKLPISRFAVAFNQEQRQQVQSRILQQGYDILFEGPGFFTVIRRPPAVSPAAAERSSAVKRTGVPFERLHQQEAARHMDILASVAGVQSTEQDVPRFLHLRPTPIRLRHRRTSRHLSAADSPAASSVAYSSQADLTQHSQHSSQRKEGLLVGHWHQSHVRYSQFPPTPYDIWGNNVGDQRCASQDTQLADAAGAEVVPWGIKRIGAWNSTIQNMRPEGRVIVCIIDSGIWLDHPEYKQMSGPGIHDKLDGCKVNASCPYTWSEDIVGHGTHVAGTIGAPQNGLGVIGVVSKGVEFHIVRIWNDSGDVSQGQGPYATDLILAYDNCLAHLKQQQQKDKNVKMVINMSYGSAGPLTVERMWIQKAAERGDVLFVGSAGNNGSWYRAADSSRGEADPGQYLSYPASYNISEMISVANARCDDTIDFSSQKNKRVNLAAPGVAILSSVSQKYGAIRAYITTSKPLQNQTEPQRPANKNTASTRSSPFGIGGYSGTGGGLAAPGETRRGLGFLPNGYREPRPVQNTQVGSTGMLPLVTCDMPADPVNHFAEAGYAKLTLEQTQAQQEDVEQQLQQPGCKGANNAVCLIELPGKIDWYKETCLAVLHCLRGGGKGLILWRNDELMQSLFRGPDDSDGGYTPDEFLLGTQVNCGINCPCWSQLRKFVGCNDADECGKKTPPAIIVSSQHAQALLAASAPTGSSNAKNSSSKVQGSGVNGSGGLRVNVTIYEFPYRHYDGTSMSAPHVTGGAALIWGLFPKCNATSIANALHESAEKLPDQTSDHDMAAGSGILRVDRAYDLLRAKKGCAGG